MDFGPSGMAKLPEVFMNSGATFSWFVNSNIHDNNKTLYVHILHCAEILTSKFRRTTLEILVVQVYVSCHVVFLVDAENV